MSVANKIQQFFSPSNPDPRDQQQQQKNLSDPNPTTNKDGKVPGSEGTPPNPLDIYNRMMEDANKATTNAAPEFKLDPKVLADVSGKMDFTQGIDQALIESALKGDAGALLKAMQQVGQNVYRDSLSHTAALTNTHLSARSSFDKTSTGDSVREALTSQALSSAPNYSHPLIKSELNRVASQIAKANPDMPPQEIAKTAQDYIQSMAKALNGEPSKEQKDVEGTDWTEYLKL